jgi:hypothetical protein
VCERESGWSVGRTARAARARRASASQFSAAQRATHALLTRHAHGAPRHNTIHPSQRTKVGGQRRAQARLLDGAGPRHDAVEFHDGGVQGRALRRGQGDGHGRAVAGGDGGHVVGHVLDLVWWGREVCGAGASGRETGPFVSVARSIRSRRGRAPSTLPKTRLVQRTLPTSRTFLPTRPPSMPAETRGRASEMSMVCALFFFFEKRGRASEREKNGSVSNEPSVLHRRKTQRPGVGRRNPKHTQNYHTAMADALNLSVLKRHDPSVEEVRCEG